MSKLNDTYAEIKKGMALAFFAWAYADAAEESGDPLRGEIMDQLPDTDPAAFHAADTLAMQMIAAHEFSIVGMSDTQKLVALYIKVLNLDRTDADRYCTPELFGHYCAMQAMGTGVGLESFGREARDAVNVPYVEFGSHSLSHDYFEPEGK